jgi:hypothetical protein
MVEAMLFGPVEVTEGQRHSPTASHLQAELITALAAEGSGSSGRDARIGRDRHDRPPLAPLEQVRVAQVQPGILAPGRSIEMM